MKTINSYAVIGLGYTGLPLACLGVKKGFKVIGIDIDQNKLLKLRNGISYINDDIVNSIVSQQKLVVTSDFSQVKEYDAIVICVPTWSEKSNRPSLTYIKNVCSNISKYLKKDHLIIIESTISITDSNSTIIPLLEKNGFEAGQDFHIAHCPERINPGDQKWNLINTPRVIGGYNIKDALIAKKLYLKLINANIALVSSLEHAAAVKIMENSFRDINIAFINEVAILFDRLGINITEVIQATSTKPFAFMPHFPSIGVGGYCIPTVPNYLIQEGKKVSLQQNIVKIGRKINDNMHIYAINRLKEGLSEVGMELSKSKITLLGLSYKKNVPETRNSPALKILKVLNNLCAKVIIYDPLIKSYKKISLKRAIHGSDAVFLATDHNDFTILNGAILKELNIKVLVDGKNFFDKKDIINHGIVYKGIGQ